MDRLHVTVILSLCIFITFGFTSEEKNSSDSFKLPLETVPCISKECSGTVIFLHGSGSSGREMRERVRDKLGKDLKFKNLKVVYPTAPLQHYSENNSQSRIWFDRLALNQSSPEDLQSIDKMAVALNKLIDNEIDSGIPIDRIVFGGFSMGGGMSLHVGLRFRQNLPGIFCLSDFLNDDSAVYADLSRKTSLKYPKVFFAHGTDDNVVPQEWSIKTQAYLRDFGITLTSRTIENLGHETSKEELLLLQDWILKIVGDKS